MLVGISEVGFREGFRSQGLGSKSKFEVPRMFGSDMAPLSLLMEARYQLIWCFSILSIPRLFMLAKESSACA